jgi:hypothetical protein
MPKICSVCTAAAAAAAASANTKFDDDDNNDDDDAANNNRNEIPLPIAVAIYPSFYCYGDTVYIVLVLNYRIQVVVKL